MNIHRLGFYHCLLVGQRVCRALYERNFAMCRTERIEMDNGTETGM